nr:hypothetical protein [Pseudoalteromonas spongiae]
MNKKELEAFARQAAKSTKSEAGLTDFCKMLTKVTVEAALNADLDEHLGYARHEQTIIKIPVMATQPKPFVPKMVKLN